VAVLGLGFCDSLQSRVSIGWIYRRFIPSYTALWRSLCSVSVIPSYKLERGLYEAIRGGFGGVWGYYPLMNGTNNPFIPRKYKRFVLSNLSLISVWYPFTNHPEYFLLHVLRYNAGGDLS
jgi:hypothetical protein